MAHLVRVGFAILSHVTVIFMPMMMMTHTVRPMAEGAGGTQVGIPFTHVFEGFFIIEVWVGNYSSRFPL